MCPFPSGVGFYQGTRQVDSSAEALAMRCLSIHRPRRAAMLILLLAAAMPVRTHGDQYAMQSYPVPAGSRPHDVAPAPEWVGNLIVSYLADRFTITGQARYTGSGKLDLLTPRTGPSDPGFNPNLTGSVTNSDVPSHTTFNLSGSYDLRVGGLERMELFGSITNVFDKDYSDGGGDLGTGGAYSLSPPRTWMLTNTLSF